MNIDILIAQARGVLSDKLAERASKTEELTALRTKLDNGDDTVTEAQVREIVEARKGIDAEIEHAQERVAEYEAEKRSDEAAAKLAREVLPPASRERAPITTGQEPRTYSPETDKRQTGAPFLRDVAASFLGDFTARDRLSRHMAEEMVERGEYMERAIGTGAFAGLTVPQYLTDLYAPAAAAARPFADVCRKLPLPPDGMTVNLSRITTATAAALQASENAAVQETNADDTLLTENVLTAAGQQTMSRQSIDRSTGAEDVILNDLFRRYHTKIDDTLLNQATTGLDAIAQQVAYTDASPTALELYPKILNAQANLEAVYLDLQVTREYAIMHSRRWAWIQSQVGTSWPFISQPSIPVQAGGTNNATAYGAGVRGTLPNGMSVVVDNNCGTTLGAGTEDRIYIVNADECFLWEDPAAPVFIRAEQPAAASLGVLLVVYGYFAYTHRRYTNGQQLVQGTGLIAPTF